MSPSKRILIIGRTIFPLQAPRSLRATELAKELGKQGHDVILYAVLGEYDYSSFENTYGVKVKNIGKMRFSTQNSDGKRNEGFFIKTFRKYFGRWLEFPDIELMFKIPSILKREKNIDLLITVAIPYPIHWGGALAKEFYPQNFPKTWVADCGDPYMGNSFYKKPFYFKYVEKWFCRKVDYLSVPLESAKDAYYSEFRNKIKIIPQGFSFDEVGDSCKFDGNNVPTFVYAGSFYPKIRDPRPFLQLLATIEREFKFVIYTKSTKLIEDYKEILKGRLIVKDYIPRHELLLKLCKADFVVNFENNTPLQSPSKLIDYALCKRPILSLNSNYEIEKHLVESFLDGDYRNAFVLDNIERFDIVNVVDRFVELIPKQVK